VKVAVVLLFIFGAAHAVSTANWHPFIPPSTGTAGQFGWSGVMRGAGIVFFAYIGFDAVSTAAQEAKNPQRDMPISIIGSLLTCTILYIAVAAVATGIVPYPQLDVPDPIAVAADHAGLGWMSSLIKLGAIAGLSSVILVMLLGQSRIFWTMAGDGLMPPFVSRVHPKFRTPWITTIVTGIVVACFAAIFTVREAGSLVSIGTLLAFAIVSIGVLVLRVREPELPRKFKTPLVWFVAPMGVVSAGYLMISLPWLTWERLIYWFALGIVIYFGYSVYHSKLGPRQVPGETGWSRALKVAGVIWIVFGSLGSILWLARYRAEYIPGPMGIVIGLAGFVLAWSLGALLNLVAQVSDHTHARHLMMETPGESSKY
jgi:APA family basic amino acid/polyamine antiporter